MLKGSIYYVEASLLEVIKNDFIFLDQSSWFSLYREKDSGSYWRLDYLDKYQEQYFVRVDDLGNWRDFDATDLKIELLKITRGISTNSCLWGGCVKNALNQLAFCEIHAFKEMGIRR